MVAVANVPIDTILTEPPISVPSSTLNAKITTKTTAHALHVCKDTFYSKETVTSQLKEVKQTLTVIKLQLTDQAVLSATEVSLF